MKLKFYEILFNHYDDIFPYNKDTYSFLREGLQDEDKVLDVACGTGSYSIALQKEGMNLCGLDQDDNMISLAEEKAKEVGVEPDFVVSSMLNLDLVSDGNLRRIFVIGNSLVHLKSLEEVRTFLSLSYELLKDGGDLIIRILNYDRILDQNITKLPTLEVPLKGITFERNYHYDETTGTIEFSSILSVKDEIKEASVHLLPIRKEELLHELEEAGFESMEVYSNFKKEPFSPDSTGLVVKAVKAKEV